MNRFGLSDENISRSWKEQVTAMALHEPERSVSNARLAGTVLSLLFGIGMIYASIFYVPAFIDVGETLGFSDQHTKAQQKADLNKKRSVLSAYTDLFKIRRGYLLAGQSLEVDYALSPGTELTVKIERCSAPPVIEVAFCMNREGQEIIIKNETRGSKTFMMRDPGFYYFDEKVTNADGSETDQPFMVMWSRRR